jgi:hypothetical protein
MVLKIGLSHCACSSKEEFELSSKAKDGLQSVAKTKPHHT